MYTAPIFCAFVPVAGQGGRSRRAPPWPRACWYLQALAALADGPAAGTLLGNALGLGSGVAYAGVFLVNTEPEGDAMSSLFSGTGGGRADRLLRSFRARRIPALSPWYVSLRWVCSSLGFPYVLIAVGIATTPPMTASPVTAIEPILTPVWVALAHGERLSGFRLPGGAGAFAAWYGSTRAAKGYARRPTFETPGRTAENPRSRAFSFRAGSGKD